MVSTQTQLPVLTNTEQAAIIFIHGYLSQNKFSPSIDEIAAALRRSKTNVHAVVLPSLRNKGWLRWVDGQARSIQLWFQFTNEEAT